MKQSVCGCLLVLVVAALCLTTAATAEYTNEALADQITTLPGATSPLVSNQFSGFLDLNVSTGHFIHYMYFESERDPNTDSIIFWTNGGPGVQSTQYCIC